ncbi:MAG: T9SS type A sorting domain-containing protein [Vicingaceae bacterium]
MKRLFFFLYFSAFAAFVMAQWPGSTLHHLKTNGSDLMTPNGSGGFFCSYADLIETNSSARTLIQNRDAIGQLIWATYYTTAASHRQEAFKLIHDGSGGVVILSISHELSNNIQKIYVQRLDAMGNLLWGPKGKLLSTTSQNHTWATDMTVDDQGNFFVSQYDQVTSSTNKLYVQKIDTAGNLLWASGGVQVASGDIDVTWGGNSASYYGDQSLVPDNHGGVFVVYMQWESGDYEVKLQRVRSGGVKAFSSPINVRGITSDGGRDARAISNNSNGIIITWEDSRNSYANGNYAQNFDTAGNALWANGAKRLFYDPYFTANNRSYVLLDLKAAGFALMWESQSELTWRYNELRMNRYDHNGKSLWDSTGILVSRDTLKTYGWNSCAIFDGSNIIAAFRTGDSAYLWTETYNIHVHAQKFNLSGSRLWSDTGIAICEHSVQAGNVKPWKTSIASDGAGGAFISWDASFDTAHMVNRVTNIGLAGNAKPSADFEIVDPVLNCLGWIDTTQFINKSQNAMDYFWNFNNEATSTKKNPDHHFIQTAGIRTVTLVASNKAGSDTIVRYLGNAFASFTCPDTISMDTSNTIPFNNTSNVTDTWRWFFGNGDSSSLKHPTISYSLPGTYTVTLISSNLQCSDTAVKTIVVLPCSQLIAPFIQRLSDTICFNDQAILHTNGISDFNHLWTRSGKVGERSTFFFEGFDYPNGLSQDPNQPPIWWTTGTNNLTSYSQTNNGAMYYVMKNGSLQTKFIDISQFNDVVITAKFLKVFTGLSGNFVKFYYQLDNGSQTFFETNGNVQGPWSGSRTARTDTLNGDSVKIIISLNTSLAGAKIDDIKLTGVPTPFSMDTLVNFKPIETTTYYLQADDGLCANIDSVHLVVHDLPVLDLGPDTNVCSGDTMMLDAGPGKTNYLWNTADTNQVLEVIAAATYWVRVTDSNACHSTDSVVVTWAVTPVVTAFATDSLLCRNDLTMLYANGADSFYWDNNAPDSLFFAPDSSRLYTVTGVLGLCKDTASVYLQVNQLPVIHLGNDTVICDEDSLILDAGTGQNKYYQWNTGDSLRFKVADSAGLYHVYVTDSNSCSNADTIQIGILVKPQVYITASDSIVCHGECTRLFGNGASFYLFSNGVIHSLSFTPDSSKRYYVVGSMGKCKDTASIFITVNRVDTAVTFNNNVMASTADSSIWQWVDCNNTFSSVVNGMNQQYAPESNGSYAVIVTQNGCTDTSSCIDVTWIGIDEQSMENVRVYPNPARDKLTVNFGELVSAATISLHNDIGQVVFEKEVGNASMTSIDMKSFAKGLYSLTIQINQKIHTQKVIKK